MEIVAEGLGFPEGPVWSERDQRLYFTDWQGKRVLSCDGWRVEHVFSPEAGGGPSGLGFSPDGTKVAKGVSNCSIAYRTRTRSHKNESLLLPRLPSDPAADHLKDGGYSKFHKIVFVSNWQLQRYIDHYRLPWSKCIVLQNAIEPIDWIDTSDVLGGPNQKISKWDNPEKIRLIYHTTPHRGLEILIPVFQKLCEKYDNLELDVFSSFELYGWKERDEHYKPLFDACEADPKITYHGTRINSEVIKKLQETHIFAYPSIWPETSCLAAATARPAKASRQPARQICLDIGQ